MLPLRIGGGTVASFL